MKIKFASSINVIFVTRQNQLAQHMLERSARLLLIPTFQQVV